MADNRKYYYLKLKENYFDEDVIVLLENQPDGFLYSNILLKLYLKSLKNGGKLQLDENKPYTAQMIATITHQQVGTVERALRLFMELGLVEVLNDGAFYMSNIELLIGQSSTEGERKRRARMELQKIPQAIADICPPEIEIKERDRYKEIDIELEKERAKHGTGRPRRLRQIQKYLSYRYGAIRAASRTARHLGFLHQTSFRVYGIQRKNLRQPRRNHLQMGGKRYRKSRRSRRINTHL